MTAGIEGRSMSEEQQQITRAFELIRQGSELLVGSGVPVFVNFGVRMLAALRACEAQWPSVVPSHLTRVE
jgi:hypothetical protein